MNAKIDYDNLYVASPVFDHKVELEPFIQHDSFGLLEHRILIKPKKRLVYSKIDENGDERFYDYKTGNEVKEYTYETSFHTESSAWENVYCTCINAGDRLNDNMAIAVLGKEISAYHRAMTGRVGYFIPFVDYVQDKLGIDVSGLSPFMADKLLRLMNVCTGRTFMLSFAPGVAEEQLKK